MSVRQTGGEFNKGISTGTEQQEKNTQKILQLQSKMSGTDPGQEKQHLEEEKNQEGQEQAPGIDQEQKARVRAVDYDQQPGGPPQVQDNIDYSTTARRRKQKSSTTKDDTDRASIASSTSFTARRRRMSVEELNRRSSRVGSIDTPHLDRPTQDPTKLVQTLELSALKYIVGVCTVCFLAGRFGFGVATAILFILVGSFAYWYFGTQPLRGYGWGLERQDGLKSLYTSEGESVEWLNFTVEKVCRSINPGFFLRLQGVIEDQLQALMPKFIKAIEIRDLDIGSQAPRIQMIHVFPPLAGQSEESIFGEVSFSFHAHPAAYLSKERGKIETSPPGVTIGVRAGIDAPPLTVRGELTALSGKIRFKIITGPEVPFVSKLTVAFTSPPTVETAVMPLTKYMNIMHLPLLKTIVNQAVTMGLADMVDPRSLTIDVRQLMGGAGNDTNALGVVCVEVREAQCDPASIHMKEMEDMYVTLSLSNQPKKSMSSTRVLTNDKDPRWNENLYVLIGKDDIVADTKVDIKVWDADKVKYDDVWGSIPWSAKDIVQAQVDKLGNITSWCQEERLIFDGWAPLDKKDIKVSRNKLHYKMTFHPKYQTPDKKAVSDDNKNKDEDKKKKRKQQEELQQKRVDPGHKSGILSVIIQQGIDLTIQDVETMPADEQKHPYNPNQVVSPYVVLYINDNKVFQTRNKLRNPSPHWNALSEHFIKDFETTTIRLSVKTSIDLERDPVIGTKVLQLAELFQDGNKKKNENENDNADEDQTFKECQTWVPLGCGIGSGKVLLTLKYKPVKLTLPQPLRTANVGTLIVDSVLLSNVKSFNTQYVKARLAVNVDPVVTRNLRNRDLNTDDHDVDEIGWYDKHLYFPLIMRQRSALYIHLIQSGISGGHKATGRLWLKQVMDDEWQDVTIGLHRYLSEQTKEANRNEDPWPEDGEYGQITMRLKIVPGFSPVFTHLHSFNTDMVGANPFHDQILTATAEKWMEEQASSVLTDDEEEEEGENEKDAGQYEKEMRSMSKPHKISKHRVLRKAAWGTDHVKHKIDTFREGFNSEARLRRSVTKET